MKTYKIPCSSEVHRIGLDDEGYLHALGHEDEEEERIAAELGDDPAECIALLLKIEEAESLDGLLIDYAKKGNAGAVDLLLESGADVHAENNWALAWASANGHAAVAKLLLESGADVHARDDLALQWASGRGHMAVAKLLLESGADVHAEDDYALRAASYGSHTEVLELLEDWIRKPYPLRKIECPEDS